MKTALILFGLICCCAAMTQQPTIKRTKTYDAWLRLKDAPGARGILYEVRDSSLVLKSSLRDTTLRVYPISEIRMIKVRRPGNLVRGAVAGGSTGAVFGFIAVNSIPGGLDFLTVPVTTWAGFAFGAVGAGMGVLAGSIKDRIPLNTDPLRFEKYRGSLQAYSVVKEPNPSPAFNHRGYAGFRIGLTWAGDELLSEELAADYPEMSTSGVYFSLYGGYRFAKFFALGITYTADSFTATQDFQDYSCEVDAIYLSPVLSVPLSPKFRINLKPSLGYAGSTYWTGPDIVFNGEGFATALDASLTYQYAKRWSLEVDGGTMSSRFKYKEGGTGNARLTHASFGVAYHFGSKSL